MKTPVEHTPSPWSALFNPLSKSAAYQILGNKGHHIATIRGDKAASHFKAEEANARLITTAPDLLSALEGFIELYEQNQLKLEGDSGNDPLILKSKAAIAKAKGQTL